MKRKDKTVAESVAMCCHINSGFDVHDNEYHIWEATGEECGANYGDARLPMCEAVHIMLEATLWSLLCSRADYELDVSRKAPVTLIPRKARQRMAYY